MELLKIADQIVAAALSDEELEVVVVDSKESEVRVYGGEVEAHTSANSQGVGVRVIKDQRQGFAFAGSLEPEMVKGVLEEARSNVEFGTQDEHIHLAKPDGVARKSLDLLDDSLREVDSDAKIDLALKLEKAVLEGHPSIIGVETVEYGDACSSAAIASTNGVRETASDGGCHLVAYSLASQDSTTETGFGYSIGRNLDELDYVKAAEQAVDRATRLLGAKKPKSFTTDIVLDPWVTAQFLSIIGGTLSGEAVVKGRSLFANRLGDKVAADCVELIDDPTNPKAPSATEIDGEGLATRQNSLIQNGVLKQFVHNSYTASRFGTSSTGSAVRGYSSLPGVGCMALSLLPGKKSQSEIISQMDKGVLIQEVSGLHSGVNPVSGDFSTGAEGLMIEGGELREPVREFIVSSTLQRMLTNIVEVGGDLEWLPMNSSGLSLLIKEVTIAGE